MEGLGAVGERDAIGGDVHDLVAVDILAHANHLAIDDGEGGTGIPEDAGKLQPTEFAQGSTTGKGVAAPGQKPRALALDLALSRRLDNGERHFLNWRDRRFHRHVNSATRGLWRGRVCLPRRARRRQTEHPGIDDDHHNTQHAKEQELLLWSRHDPVSLAR